MIGQVGRKENVVGWYHSHPGYGCWLSGIDVSTQMTNQAFQDPFLSVVVSQKSVAPLVSECSPSSVDRSQSHRQRGPCRDRSFQNLSRGANRAILATSCPLTCDCLCTGLHASDSRSIRVPIYPTQQDRRFRCPRCPLLLSRSLAFQVIP